MFALILSAIARIRKKSLAERRVWGTAVFTSSAFIVIALWIVSMDSLLQSASPAELGNAAERNELLSGADSSGEKIEAKSGDALMTPFQSLQAWLEKARDEAKRTFAGASSPEREASKPIEEVAKTAESNIASSTPERSTETAEQQTPAKENFSAGTDIKAATKKAAAKTAKPAPSPRPQEPTVGKVLAAVYATDPAASWSVAKLASPPRDAAVKDQRPKSGFYGEAMEIAKYNFAEMGRAARGIYQYLAK